MSCTCVKQEAGKGKGKVKGYIVTTLCPECVAQQEADAIAQAEQQEQEDVQVMIAQKAQTMAEDALVSEGKIEKKNGKMKKK